MVDITAYRHRVTLEALQIKPCSPGATASWNTPLLSVVAWVPCVPLLSTKRQVALPTGDVRVPSSTLPAIVTAFELAGGCPAPLSLSPPQLHSVRTNNPCKPNKTTLLLLDSCMRSTLLLYSYTVAVCNRL